MSDRSGLAPAWRQAPPGRRVRTLTLALTAHGFYPRFLSFTPSENFTSSKDLRGVRGGQRGSVLTYNSTGWEFESCQGSSKKSNKKKGGTFYQK